LLQQELETGGIKSKSWISARINETANLAPGNAVTLGQILERSGAADRELLKPHAPPRNRRDHGRITLPLGSLWLRMPAFSS
jgi:hypothetical protein